MAEVKPIVKEPNKVLRLTAEDVPIKDVTGRHIHKLIASMKVALKNTPDGVGLAAPQVGESLRLFIVSEEAEEIDKAEKRGWERRDEKGEKNPEMPYEKREWKYYVFINPVIKKVSKQKFAGPEGCLSVPGRYGTVRRNEKITIQAHDETGRKFTRGASRFFARVMQHELDHLEGTLFIDKADRILDTKGQNDQK